MTGVPDPESRVSVQEIDRFVAGADSHQLDVGEIVGLVSSHQKVTSVRSVEFGIYAVAGAINSEELTSITGMHDVRSDAGVGATSRGCG